MKRFEDREDAGQFLADRLARYAGKPDTLVLGLARGGVAVAYEAARKLKLPLNVFIVRKLSVPGYEELAMGAIASGGTRAVNDDLVRNLRISEAMLHKIANRELEEINRREELYRKGRPPLDVRDKTVILVDDGLATGATMRAAVLALRKQQPKKIVVAVPVAAPDTCEEFAGDVDDTVCGMTPAYFNAVGAWYENFSQTTDEEVIRLLKAAADEKSEGQTS